MSLFPSGNCLLRGSQRNMGVCREGEIARGFVVPERWSPEGGRDGGSRASIAARSRQQRAVKKSHLAEFVSVIHSSGRHPRDFIKCNCPTASFHLHTLARQSGVTAESPFTVRAERSIIKVN